MNTLIAITLVVGVVHILVHNEFGNDEMGLLAYAIWVIVFGVSLLCCYYYVILLYNFRPKLLYEQCQRCGTVLVFKLMVAFFCLGLLSMYSFLQQAHLAGSKVFSTNSNRLWNTVFSSTVFSGVLQRFLSGILNHYHTILYVVFVSPFPEDQ